MGWGIAFFVPQLAGYIKDVTGSLDGAFYLSGGLLVAANQSHFFCAFSSSILCKR
jgi:hypothetical protein